MSKIIEQLISILLPTYKKGKRRNFTTKNKEQVISKQKGKCAICRGYLNRWERIFIIKMVIDQIMIVPIVKQHIQGAIEKNMQKKDATNRNYHCLNGE
jgi:hypothetical protein